MQVVAPDDVVVVHHVRQDNQQFDVRVPLDEAQPEVVRQFHAECVPDGRFGIREQPLPKVTVER